MWSAAGLAYDGLRWLTRSEEDVAHDDMTRTRSGHSRLQRRPLHAPPLRSCPQHLRHTSIPAIPDTHEKSPPMRLRTRGLPLRLMVLCILLLAPLSALQPAPATVAAAANAIEDTFTRANQTG